MYAGYLACDPEDHAQESQSAMTKFTLAQHNLTVEEMHHNLSRSSLYDQAIWQGSAFRAVLETVVLDEIGTFGDAIRRSTSVGKLEDDAS